MLADLLQWLAIDSEIVVARGSRILASEMRFGGDDHVGIDLPDGRRIELRGLGRPRRCDPDGGLVVTDHKTGAKTAYKGLTGRGPHRRRHSCQLPRTPRRRCPLGVPDDTP